jgi:hypothetical protein
MFPMLLQYIGEMIRMVAKSGAGSLKDEFKSLQRMGGIAPPSLRDMAKALAQDEGQDQFLETFRESLGSGKRSNCRLEPEESAETLNT